MAKIRLVALTGVLLAVQAFAQKAEVCPAISCDCGSLPKPEWQATCEDHETKIKKNCAANANTPADYCSLHGPSAKPLPLAIEFSNISVISEQDLPQQSAKVSQLYSASDNAIKLLKAKLSSYYFKEGLAVSKELDATFDELFDAQRAVTMSWLLHEEEKEALSAWRSYSERSLERAEILSAYSAELWNNYLVEKNGAAKKAYKVLAFKVWRVAGKAYEMSAYAFSGADKSEQAAEAWLSGAGVSQAVLEAKQASQAKASHINFYKYQAASRLHRASYYFALEGEAEDALKTLAMANDVSPGNELAALIALEEDQEAAELTNL
ncbi:hypothetical protein SAMN02745866_04145 [Alteromonadaceae bacterium Bs31]|nr:hypothetical protein SAMN02745866_04145 [Alteromonadaceae bacterium Bs31]